MVEAGPSEAGETGEGALDRPDSFAVAAERLTWLERANIRFCRWSTTTRWMHRLCGWFQRKPGALWVHLGSRNLRKVAGLDRLPDFEEIPAFVIASNHRSYFDLFVVSMILFRHGLRRRILFPVRSNFFYDRALGFFVNGIMSFWSMYPPVFRDRKRASLNRTALSEMVWTLQNTRSAVGIHPEGRRNQGEDPYALLPAQAGLGRIVSEAEVPVLPVFINGLGNSFWGQLKRNFRRTDDHVIVVFGAPVDYGDLEAGPAGYKQQRAIAQRALDEIAKLAAEEKALRAALEAGESPEALGLRRG